MVLMGIKSDSSDASGFSQWMTSLCRILGMHRMGDGGWWEVGRGQKRKGWGVWLSWGKEGQERGGFWNVMVPHFFPSDQCHLIIHQLYWIFTIFLIKIIYNYSKLSNNSVCPELVHCPIFYGVLDISCCKCKQNSVVVQWILLVPQDCGGTSTWFCWCILSDKISGY